MKMFVIIAVSFLALSVQALAQQSPISFGEPITFARPTVGCPAKSEIRELVHGFVQAERHESLPGRMAVAKAAVEAGCRRVKRGQPAVFIQYFGVTNGFEAVLGTPDECKSSAPPPSSEPSESPEAYMKAFNAWNRAQVKAERARGCGPDLYFKGYRVFRDRAGNVGP